MTKYEQDKQLIKDVLERHYFQKWREDIESAIEIYVYGLCKSNCKYCYLKKHQEEIYPTELNDISTIIHNFELVIDWYIKNKFICMIDFFSAEWLTTPLFEPMMQIMYDKFKNTKFRPFRIIAADNMQFLWDEEKTKQIRNWFDKFKEELNIEFTLSASVDGYYCDQDRVLGNDVFYKRLWDFMEDYDLRAHPMVSSYNIHNWIDNYIWWQNNAPYKIARPLTMLEVRDSTWDKKSIQELITFTDFLVDYQFEHFFNKNKLDFLKYVLGFNLRKEYPYSDPGYNSIGILSTDYVTGQDHMACSFNHQCGIRLGDLTIAPCHRLWYKEFLIAQLQTNKENNQIIDIAPLNITLGIVKARIKTSCLPHCESCPFVGICIGFCMGQAYEHHKNFLIPTKEVCDLYKAKLTFLIYKYQQMGLWELLPQIQNYNLEQIKYLQTLIPKILQNFEKDIK